MECNIHFSLGDGDLGKWMSNLANAGITVPEDGYFRSIESYWYWLSISEECETRDDLRYMYGHECKKYGSKLRSEFPNGITSKCPLFRDKICTAIKIKIANHKDIRKAFVDFDGSFTHYMYKGGQEINMARNCQWWLDFLNKFNRAVKMWGEDNTLSRYEY